MHLYSVLLCIAVHPKRFTIMRGEGGGGVGCLSTTTTSGISIQYKYFCKKKMTLILFENNMLKISVGES